MKFPINYGNLTRRGTRLVDVQYRYHRTNTVSDPSVLQLYVVIRLMAFDQKAANLWVARFIPLILIGIVGYVTWVVVALVCGKERNHYSPFYGRWPY